ncbi:MAG: tRNA methyltransferase complex GCD14 subunit [Cenarchaeum symbiont of Oopsacas minuta]|nr:tRNA methyltransferase complex GCD14 subunit [Cenarchaeum symbiont of Oopsacas minuta]
MDKIKRGSDVLFYYNSGKKWLVKLQKSGNLHTHIGIISHEKAVGKKYGSRLVTNKEKYVYLFKPTAYDYVMKMQHGTQIVYPKDLGYIAARTGLTSGQIVLEIGTGSGALTGFAAGIVKPRGKVYTFDVDEKFMAIAAKNIDRAGVTKYVIMKNHDIKRSRDITVPAADVAIVDLGDPWIVVPQIRKMLKDSGAFVAICPTMNQLEKLAMALTQNEFADIECTEHIIRTIEAREGKTRHSFQGIGHTTYLCIARKAYFNSTRRTIAKKTSSDKKTQSSKNK